MSAIQPRREVLLTNVAATTTSAPFGVDGAGRLSFQYTSTGLTTGSAVFKVQVSNDGTNWVDYNRLTTNVTNTNAQTDTRVASVLLSITGSSMVFVPPGDTFNFARAVVTPNNVVDGTYSVTAYVN